MSEPQHQHHKHDEGVTFGLLLGFFAVCFVLVGAGTEVVNSVPVDWPAFDFSRRVLTDYAVLAWQTAVKVWWIVGLAWVVCLEWRALSAREEIHRNVYETKVAVAALRQKLRKLSDDVDVTKWDNKLAGRGLEKDDVRAVLREELSRDCLRVPFR